MTGSTGPDELVINTRTLRIGHQTYQLSNLARVQTAPLPPPSNEGKGNKALAWAAGILAFVAVILPLDSAIGGGVTSLGLVACIGLSVLVYQKTRVRTRPQYALMLETTGAPFVALVSHDQRELIRVSDIIVNAIENPPDSERHITVNNVHYGDSIHQNGGLNIGKLGDHGGTRR